MFYVYGCLKCHSVSSFRILESKKGRPKRFKCFICNKSRSVERETPLFFCNTFLEALEFIRRKKLKTVKEMNNSVAF